MKKSFLAVVICSIFGCGGGDAPPKSTWNKEQLKEKRQLVNAVMAVHDSTMVFMDKIHTSIELLEERTLSSDSSLVDSAIKLLQVADDEMMNWMRNYREPKDTNDFSKAKKYLIDQKEAIELVEEQTTIAISFADNILRNESDSIK